MPSCAARSASLASCRGVLASSSGRRHWRGDAPPPPAPANAARSGDHVAKDVEQTQIAVAYGSVPVAHADYYAAMGAVNVLSGGMSSRLFTEIREKRGLCYSVWASYQTFKDRASVVAYAGTTNERAQETLDVLLGELRRLPDGVEMEEVERVQAGLKSSLIMQQESTSARALSLASDWYNLGRVRSFDEIQSAVNAARRRRASCPTSAVIRRPTSPSSPSAPSRWKSADFTTRHKKPTRRDLWLGVGRDDGALKGVEELHAFLEENIIRHAWRLTEGTHEFTLWRPYPAEFASLLFQPEKP